MGVITVHYTFDFAGRKNPTLQSTLPRPSPQDDRESKLQRLKEALNEIEK